MKAIETHYKGYRFRSRLEARWAVYFDAEQIEWEYEKEGYRLRDLDGAFYLPDFWLPQVSMFAEVKPSAITKEELAKCLALSAESGHPVLLLDGPPDFRSYFAFDSAGGCDDFIVSSYHSYHVDERRFYTSTGAAWPNPATDVKGFLNVASIHAARSARFEHGESGVKLPVYREPQKAPTKKHADVHSLTFGWAEIVERVEGRDRDFARLLRCTMPVDFEASTGTVILERDPFETLTPEDEKKLRKWAPLASYALAEMFYGVETVRVREEPRP